jgi:hypothetical protein
VAASSESAACSQTPRHRTATVPIPPRTTVEKLGSLPSLNAKPIFNNKNLAKQIIAF